MSENYSNVAVIVPAYNEEKVIKKNLTELSQVFPFVVCVNDGSSDKTAEEARKTDSIVLSHLTNIGQGGALETGIKFALKNPKIDYFVTFDADGQHQIEDIIRMIARIKKSNVDILLGSRFIGKNDNNIPTAKKVMFFFARIFTNWTTGLKLTDTHNGLRVFNRKYASKVDLTNYGFAHASEFLEIIKKNNFKFEEFPVTINYTEYSKSKGQPIINLVNILFDVLFK